MAEASHARCLLRCDGAEPGSVQEHEFADPNDYWTLRRRSTGGVHVLQAAYAVRNRGSEGESLPDYWAVGPRGNAHAESGSGGIEIRPSKRPRPEQVAHRMVRLGDEGRTETGISEEARGLLLGWSGGMEVRGQSREHLERSKDAVSRFECGSH